MVQLLSHCHLHNMMLKNGLRSNKTSFALQSDTKPIFQKQFNPSDSSVLDIATDTFTIVDHFFETGERLVYAPGSTFLGISLAGITTSGGVLPSELYAIRINKDKLKVAKNTSRCYCRKITNNYWCWGRKCS